MSQFRIYEQPTDVLIGVDRPSGRNWMVSAGYLQPYESHDACEIRCQQRTHFVLFMRREKAGELADGLDGIRRRDAPKNQRMLGSSQSRCQGFPITQVAHSQNLRVVLECLVQSGCEV